MGGVILEWRVWADGDESADLLGSLVLVDVADDFIDQGLALILENRELGAQLKNQIKVSVECCKIVMWQNIDTYSFDESLHLRLVGAKSVQKGLQGIDGISADLAL